MNFGWGNIKPYPSFFLHHNIRLTSKLSWPLNIVKVSDMVYHYFPYWMGRIFKNFWDSVILWNMCKVPLYSWNILEIYQNIRCVNITFLKYWTAFLKLSKSQLPNKNIVSIIFNLLIWNRESIRLHKKHNVDQLIIKLMACLRQTTLSVE